MQQPFSWKLIHWSNASFLLGTLFITLTAVPVYLWHYGLSAFHGVLFLIFFILTGLSISLGYHRLFSHRAFKASWPVRLLTLAFGAATFENSVLMWVADHRRHHKFVDHDEDPYNISKGFFHAHMGWILFRYEEDTSLSYVDDLQQDRMVRWQHDYYKWVAIGMGFVLPAVLGFLWGGWVDALGAFLIAGVARTVFVQHMTFCINSLCHTLGRQPYSTKNTARDSGLMAWFTFGEGYHNFHHAFQHDYRNGVKAWQFDPTKWTIWLLHKIGLARQLKRIPPERIMLAEIAEQQRRLADHLDKVPLAESLHSRIQAAQLRLQQAFQHWERLESEYSRAVEKKLESSKEKIAELRREFQGARARFRMAIREWQDAHRTALAQFAACPAS